MKIIKINKKKFNQTDIDLIVDYLLKEKVVVLPTDTVYGLHCLADSKKALKRIDKIKERSGKAGFVHLMRSYCQVHEFCKVSAKQDKVLRQAWPPTTRALQNKEYRHSGKPTTFILDKKTAGSKGLETIAVRLPKDDFLLTILKGVKMPLVSTSFNLSGKPGVPFAQVSQEFETLPDLIVDAGEIRKQASRIVDVRDVDDIKILRK